MRYLSTIVVSMFLSGCVTTGPVGGVLNANSPGTKTVKTKTAVDRAIGKCVATIVGGAISGAILGSLLGGSREAGKGALIGGAVGAGSCAILIKLAAAEDKDNLHRAQLNALAAKNGTSSSSFKTKSGQTAHVKTTVTSAPLPPKIAAKPATIRSTKPVSQPSKPPKQAPQTTVASAAQKNLPSITTNDQSIQTASFVDDQANFTECKFTKLLINLDGSSTDTDEQKWCKKADGAWQPITT